MLSFFRFIMSIVKWFFLIFALLLIILWASGALKDRELSPEAVEILSILKSQDVPAKENRFFYLAGFESPSSYEPEMWGEMWLNEQKRFYRNPEHTWDNFYFYQEQEDFKNSPVRARLLQDEVAGYSEIWEGVPELFSNLETESFPVGIQRYFTSLEKTSGPGVDLEQGKRDMFVKRYIQARSIQQSIPVMVEHVRAELFSPWRTIQNSHKYLLLDACNRFLDDDQRLYIMDMVLDEIIVDMSALQQWYQTSGDLLESMVVRTLLKDSMNVSVFLLQTVKREQMTLHSSDKLFEMVLASADLLKHYIPRKAIAEELNIVDVRIDSWAKSQQDLESYINLMDEMMESFGGGTYHPPLLARVLVACPEKFYPVLVNLFVKKNHTKNVTAEGFMILLGLDEMGDDSGEVKQLLDEQERSADTLLNYLYNPLGMQDLSIMQEDRRYESPAKMMYNYLYSDDRRKKVVEITEKLRAI